MDRPSERKSEKNMGQKYNKSDLSNVLWTDEMRVTLDEPDRRACGCIVGDSNVVEG